MEEKIILECYQCATQFKIAPSLLGNQGKKVRCTRCKHEWIAKAPLEKPQQDIQPPQKLLSPEDTQPILPNTATNLLAESNKQEKLFFRAPLESNSTLLSSIFLFIVLLITLPTFLYIGRYKVVEFLPNTRVLYQRLGIHAGEDLTSFSLSNLSYTQALQNAISTIIVKGQLKNTADKIMRTPNVIVSLYGKGNCSVTNWKDKILSNESNTKEDGHCILERWSVQLNENDMIPAQQIAIETSRRINPKWQIKHVFMDLVSR